MGKYLIHKAVELDKVTKARKALLSAPGYLEKNFIAQPKFDGCNMIFKVSADGTWGAWSRTGEEIKSVDHVAMAMLTFPDMVTGVYLGEAWIPDTPFPEISGLFRTGSTTEETCKLQFAIFDYLTLEEWDNGKSEMGYANRVARMAPALGQIPQGQAPIWLAGSYGHIHEVWNEQTTAQQICNLLVEAGGYDGLILRDPYGEWEAGDSGTGGEIIKVKAKQTFDLRVVGWLPGKGKHDGKIGTLLVDFRGAEQGAGTGLKDAERDASEFADRWLGKIVEIECLGVTADGMLREPRLKGIRHDKLEPDA